RYRPRRTPGGAERSVQRIPLPSNPELYLGVSEGIESDAGHRLDSNRAVETIQLGFPAQTAAWVDLMPGDDHSADCSVMPFAAKALSSLASAVISQAVRVTSSVGSTCSLRFSVRKSPAMLLLASSFRISSYFCTLS